MLVKLLKTRHGLKSTSFHDVAVLLEEQDQLVVKSDHLTRFLDKEKE